AASEQAQLPLMVMVTPGMLGLIDDISQRYPRLQLAMCHLALPSGAKDEVAFANLDKLLTLARRPNIMVKITALPDYTVDAYPYRRLHPYLRRVYDAFGSRRMFWGTDLSRLHCSYRQAVTMITEEIPWLSTTDKEWVMGRGLCEWLG